MSVEARPAPDTRRRRPPLGESLVRVNDRQGRMALRFGRPTEPGWVSCADFLADPGSFPRWRAELGRWLREQYGDAPDRTTAGYVATWYLSVPGYLAALLFHHERRVPSLRPADVAFRIGRPRPRPDAVAAVAPGFACLPDDPAAGGPEAVVVPDEQALAAVLRGRFCAHAARFVAAFAPQTRLGKRTLWAAATDALDNSLWLAGRYGGDERGGVLDAAMVLGDGPSPFTSSSTLRPAVVADDDGAAVWTRRRESCCFHYLLDGGKGPCGTCPRVHPKA